MLNKCIYKDGYKYQLARDLEIALTIFPPEVVETQFLMLTPYGELTIKKGYAWDGPSGPSFDTDTFMRGSLVHDALYQLIANKLIDKSKRKKADDTLRRICIEDGMSRFRAWYVYKAVRRFGGNYLAPKTLYICP